MFVKIGEILNKPSTYRGLLFGVLAFFLIKFFFISIGFFGMSGPRLGDDAYVYMWGAISTPFSGLNESPGISSLASFSSEILSDEIDDEDKFAYYRVLLRTVSTSSNMVHYLFGLLQPEGWSFYGLFWLQELFVLCVMTTGVLVLLKNQTKLFGIGLMLPLAALALFPAQGMHFFIPSTLALSFGMIVWGLVIGANPRPLFLFFAALLAMLSHKIGVVHASIGGWIVLYFLFTKKINLGRAITEICAMVAALAIFVATDFILSPKNAAASELITYGFSNMLSNLAGAANYTFNMTKTDPLGLILILFGLVAFLRNFKTFNPLNVLLFILLINVAVMSLHFLDEYPGEAMIRLLVPVFFVLVLLVHTKIVKNPETKNSTKLRTEGAFYILFLVGMAFTNLHYLMGNVEKRWAQIDRKELQNVLANIKPDSHLLYLEEDIALEASLVTSVYSNKLSSISLLKASPVQADNWLSENPPTHVVALVPRNLTPSRKWELPLWTHRKPGFNLRNDGKLELAVGAEQLFIKLDSSPDNFSISNRADSCELSGIEGTHWYEVADNCFSKSINQRVVNVSGNGSVIGISTTLPVENLNWPWGQDIKYEFKSGSFFGRDYEEISSSFNWHDLDSDFNETFIRDALGSTKSISDNSGLVFVEVR